MSNSIQDSAWGLRLTGPEIDPGLLVQGTDDFPLVHVSVLVSDPYYTPIPLLFNDQEAEIDLFGSGFVRVDRRSQSTELHMMSAPTSDEIVHPLLASTAVIMNHWLGRVCLHAGAMVVNGGAWALLGHQTHGKSSTLGWAAAHGVPVLTDDVLAIHNGQAYAGPRCVDLRKEAAQRLGIGRELRRSGLRERWRVTLDEIEPVYPLRGIVFLDWNEELELTRVPAREVISRLFDYLALRYEPDPVGLLELASFPAWQWRRPQSWRSMNTSMEALVQLLGT